MLKLPTKPNSLSINSLNLDTAKIADSPEPSSQKPLIVKLDNVRKTYVNGAVGLRDVNVELRKGDFKFITGHSGSGKSTLLKLLYGAEQATDGDVIVNGVNLNGLKGDRLAMLRRKIGIVFQDYKLVPRRPVSENVAFVLMAQGYTYKEIQRRVQPALKMVGLLHKADCFPEQQKRIHFSLFLLDTRFFLVITNYYFLIDYFNLDRRRKAGTAPQSSSSLSSAFGAGVLSGSSIDFSSIFSSFFEVPNDGMLL